MRALFLILHSVGILIFATTWGYPLTESTGEIGDDVTKPGNLNSTTIDCRSDLLLKPNEFSFHPNGTAFVLDTNKILKPSEYITVGGNLCIIENGNDKTTTESPLSDLTKWYYNPVDFSFLFNSSVPLHNEFLEKDVDGIFGFTTEKPVDDYDYETTNTKNDSTREALMHTAEVGASISILSLCLHLLVFALMPAASRNLQSYSLACLSIAFIVDYFFFLFGQIPNISHVFCVITASFQYFFCLAAYFWMSVIAYDVWRCLTLAIHHNLAPSSNDRKGRFLFYSIYAWGIPLVLVITTLSDGFSSDEAYKPYFGRYSICWFTNTRAKNIYFGIPFIAMLVFGTKLFIRGVAMMVRNTIDPTSDPQRNALRNLALYARLAVIMAILWSIGMAAAVVSEQKILWVIFDALNSFQGFFIFMFYSFNRVRYFCRNKSKSTSADTAALFIIENSTSRSESQSDSIQ